MSYDLVFWKQTRQCNATPAVVYGELMDGRTVEGLESIDTDSLLAKISERFPSITEDGGLVFWDGGNQGSFEIYSSTQHVHFCCRQMSEDNMNILIDVALLFGCRLYDPQTDTRYDGSKE